MSVFPYLLGTKEQEGMVVLCGYPRRPLKQPELRHGRVAYCNAKVCPELGGSLAMKDEMVRVFSVCLAQLTCRVLYDGLHQEICSALYFPLDQQPSEKTNPGWCMVDPHKFVEWTLFLCLQVHQGSIYRVST